MSEAELHFIRARLQGGILSKARRGELQMPLPVGLTYDPAGKVVLDPDADRLALIDETGRYIGEELTLALAVLFRLRQERGTRCGRSG